MTLGYKGRLVAKLSVAKANFHSAGDDTTAAEDLVAVWNRLQAQADRYNEGVTGMFDALQVALQAVSRRSDGLTQTAAATVSYRLPPALAPDVVKGMVAGVVEELLGTAQCTFTGAETAYRGAKDTALTRAFQVAIRAHGGEPRLKVKTGTADMNVVAPVWKVPMLAYGPGDSALDHTPEEHLPLGDYERAIAVLTTALTRLAGV